MTAFCVAGLKSFCSHSEKPRVMLRLQWKGIEDMSQQLSPVRDVLKKANDDLQRGPRDLSFEDGNGISKAIVTYFREARGGWGQGMKEHKRGIISRTTGQERKE